MAPALEGVRAGLAAGWRCVEIVARFLALSERLDFGVVQEVAKGP